MFPEVLTPGLPVVYYPVRGIALEHIDLSDTDQFLLYEVESVSDDHQVALKSADEQAHGNIVKHFDEMIEEGRWWTRLKA